VNATIRLIFSRDGAGATVQVLIDELLVAVAGYTDAGSAARDVSQILQTGLLPGASERLALELEAATCCPTVDQVKAGLYVVQMLEPGDVPGDVAASLRLTGCESCVAFANELDAGGAPRDDEPDDQDTLLQRIRDREAES
jgi:S-adenosylmethionine/arginine decarboxylase-like enzyme